MRHNRNSGCNASTKILIPCLAVAGILLRPGSLPGPVSGSVGWATYNGQLNGNRYSPLSLINTSNVANLGLVYNFNIPTPTPLETTPLVAGSTMYITSTNSVYTYDVTTGKPGWSFVRAQTPGVVQDAGAGVNRGAAIGANSVFITTDNAHLLSLHITTGVLQWETVIADYTQNYGTTAAPLYLPGLNLVVSGVSGGDSGVRGFLAAYDANTGDQVWQFFTTPSWSGDPLAVTWGDGSVLPHGGGAPWMTGTFDTAANILYWGVGNPSPEYDGSGRLGDNLYTSSVLALNASTGALIWYFQFTPHNVWDYDGTSTPMLVTTQWQGVSRNLLFQANRNGYFYVLDRGTGQYLSGWPFVKNLTWATGLDSNGRPTVNAASVPSTTGASACPDQLGAANFQSVAYHPGTGLFYVQAREGCSVYTIRDPNAAWRPGAEYPGGVATQTTSPPSRKHLRAINPATGSIVWDYAQQGYGGTYGGVLATAGGLVFFGDDSGALSAAQANTGALLWTYVSASKKQLKGSPMTYELNGKQFVAIAMPSSVAVFGLPASPTGPTQACAANAAQVGVYYSSSLKATGGTPPYRFSIPSGALPSGLMLDGSTGAITGTPTTGGRSVFMAKVVDSSGTTTGTTNSCGIIVNPLPLVFVCPGSPEEVGALALDSFVVRGGVPPYSFSISLGALPMGVTLNTTSGVITGTPSLAGNYTFTGTVADSTGTSAGTTSAPCSVSVAPAVAMACPANKVTVRTAYSSAIGVLGGVSPYQFSVSSGVLPTGLTLDSSSGAITGTPTLTGTFSFTATVEDETGMAAGVATGACTITVLH